MELPEEIQEKLTHLWGKVGFILNLSQMIEYTLANILAFDEILREFEKTDSMFVYEFNIFAEKSNKWYKTFNEKLYVLVLNTQKKSILCIKCQEDFRPYMRRKKFCSSPFV